MTPSSAPTGEHYTDYDTRLAAYAVVVDEQRRVLLARWNGGSRPQWTMPGGGVELHESVEEAAVREVLEETGYDVRLEELLGVDSWVMPPQQRFADTDRPLKAVRVVFRATVTGGELRHEVGGSTDEAAWVPIADVPGLERVSLVDASLAMLERRPTDD